MRCNVCGNEQGNTTYRIREMLHGIRDEFAYYQCAACQCLQIVELPDDLSRYYGEDYYSFSAAHVQAHTPRKSKRLRLRRDRATVFGGDPLGWILCRLPRPYGCSDQLTRLRHVPLKLDSRILDVGCGAGSYLVLLESVGFSKLTGIDPFIEGDTTVGANVRLLKRTMDEVGEEFDLVYLSHSLEHMPDCHQAFAGIEKLMAPDGVCVIRTPIIPCHAWWRYGTNWVLIDAPRHAFVFSLRSIELLAEKHGLRVTHIEYDSTAFQFWGSEQYLRDIPLYAQNSYNTDPEKSIFSPSQIREYARMAGRLNRQRDGDQCAIYLRKDQGAISHSELR